MCFVANKCELSLFNRKRLVQFYREKLSESRGRFHCWRHLRKAEEESIFSNNSLQTSRGLHETHEKQFSETP